jgi:hypothetical protein
MTTLKITRLHDWARRAKTVTSQRADYDAAVLARDSVDELIDAYLDSVFIFGQYETDLATMFKKPQAERDKTIFDPAFSLAGRDLAAPIPAATVSQFFLTHPGPHWLAENDGFSYVEREPYLLRGKSAGNNYEGPGVTLDYVLKGVPDGRPILAQYKSADDTPPFGALVQLLAHSAMLSSPVQMDRLKASCPDAGFGAEPAIPMDLCLIFNRNGRTKNPIFNMNWDDSLACVQIICGKLVKSAQVSRYIRRVRLLRANIYEGAISFTEFPPAR